MGFFQCMDTPRGSRDMGFIGGGGFLITDWFLLALFTKYILERIPKSPRLGNYAT